MLHAAAARESSSSIRKNARENPNRFNEKLEKRTCDRRTKEPSRRAVTDGTAETSAGQIHKTGKPGTDGSQRIAA
eukprot:scaffold7052_cov254-Pinguiococcus_pyrenoidosus.AAC.89